MKVKYVNGLDAIRRAAKASKRADTTRRMASGELTPEAAQQEAAPYTVKPLKMEDFWKHVSPQKRRKS